MLIIIGTKREEIGRQFSLTGRIARIQMMWADHLVQMEESRSFSVDGGGQVT